MTDDERKAATLANLAKGRQTAARNRALRLVAAAQPPAKTVSAPEPEIEEEEIQFERPSIAPGGEPVEIVRDPDPDPQGEVMPLDAFGRFLVGLDSETRAVLGDDELQKIFAEQQIRAGEEKRGAMKKAVAARALHHARVESGLVDVSVLDDRAWRDRMEEKVTFTIDLPELGDVGLRVDQRIYLHGHSYTLSRAEYDSMRYAMYVAQQNELLFEGHDRRHWLRRRARGQVATYIEMGA